MSLQEVAQIAQASQNIQLVVDTMSNAMVYHPELYTNRKCYTDGYFVMDKTSGRIWSFQTLDETVRFIYGLTYWTH
jgi:hypothetical protein